MANFIRVHIPATAATVQAISGVAASGTYNAETGELRRIWAKVIRAGDQIPDSPWEIEAPVVNVNLSGSGPWNFPDVPGAVHGSDNRLVVWGGFSGTPTARIADDLPEFFADVDGTGSGSGSGFGEIGLVSAACSVRGGVPRTLFLTIGQSNCEPLAGTNVKLRWNGNVWRGLMKLPDGTYLPWRLETLRGCKTCKPADFRITCGDRKPQRPTQVCCNPFELVWHEKQVIKLGSRGSKACPPGTTANITVSE